VLPVATAFVAAVIDSFADARLQADRQEAEPTFPSCEEDPA